MTVRDSIRLAYKKRYRVLANGDVRSPVGNVLRLRISEYGGYRTANFSINSGIDGKTTTVPVHRLVAFQKFGEAAMEDGIHTRHLDGNSLNNRLDNIAIGSASDNHMDKPEKVRRDVAAKGNRQHSDELISKLRKHRSAGMKYSELMEKYGLPKSTLSFYLSPTAKLVSYSSPPARKNS